MVLATERKSMNCYCGETTSTLPILTQRGALQLSSTLPAAADQFLPQPRQRMKDRRTRIKWNSCHRGLVQLFSLLMSLLIVPSADCQIVNSTAGDGVNSTAGNSSGLDPSLSPTNLGLTEAETETSLPTQQQSFANSLAPTDAPSSSNPPTMLPTVSPLPSVTPSISLAPSVSWAPSNVPSLGPTNLPSATPTEVPSVLPTFTNRDSESANFAQMFTLAGSKFFSESEVVSIGILMENYTAEFAPDSIGEVNTTFTEIDQKSSLPALTVITVPPENRQLRYSQTELLHNSSTPALQRSLQVNMNLSFVNTLTYTMLYESSTMNVTDYPAMFESFINGDTDRLTADLNELGINVTETDTASRFFQQTSQPTDSTQPSVTPTIMPTISPPPSTIPSFAPTAVLSNSPTISSMPSQSVSELPSRAPSMTPTFAPSSEGSTVIIVVVVVIVGSLLMFGLLMFYRRRKRFQEQQFHASQSMSMQKRSEAVSNHQGGLDGSWNAAVGKSVPPTALQTHDPKTQYSPDGRGHPLGGGEGIISPSESLVSNQSLLSAGNSMGGGDSGDEADTTQNLQDEFDQYKDQNLEKMRAEVEGNLSGFDGMMSQALTKALMDDDELNVEPSELLWGGVGQQSGAEVEASALCEVTDWLKRNDNAAVDGKRTFMQEMLNKMVSSVRHGVLGPDDASRAIHECAALLNLQLASDLPVTTVIITGMRKMVTAADVIEAFREFGEIDDAAVASNQRGFGLVRFKTPKSVDRAMRKFLIEEIVVQDVAVQVKVLTPTMGGDAAFRSVAASQVSNGPVS